MGIRRGTTPTHVIETDIDMTEVTVLYISYTQNGRILVEKSLEDVEIDGSTLRVRLTQAETLLFTARPLSAMVEIQVRVGFADGNRLASEIMKTTVEGLLKDGEI